MEAVNKRKFVGRLSLAARWPLQRCNSSFFPNECFSQKRLIVNPRTTVFLKNMRLSTPERVAAMMQQLILPTESFVTRRNRCLFEACDAGNSIFALFAPLLAHNKLWLQSFKRHFYNLFILLLSLQKF